MKKFLSAISLLAASGVAMADDNVEISLSSDNTFAIIGPITNMSMTSVAHKILKSGKSEVNIVINLIKRNIFNIFVKKKDE